MRKYIRQKILRETAEITGRHSQIEQSVLKENYDIVQNLLMQCQEDAIWIGNAIDEKEPEGSAVIKRLENYCEALYRYSVQVDEYAVKKKNGQAGGNSPFVLLQFSLNPADSDNLDKSGSVRIQLDQYLADVKEYAKNHPAEKIEAVFLPYKASMWDSLESVWMAAKEDENCDAFVIPIPYFDKNPDGTLAEMHYEGSQFPEYVPVTDWKEYDLEARHPDMVFIHNPYDNMNIVTTVHPDFYAQKIKDETERLVYIPYFVCVNDTVEEHFCVLPGTLYADKVILQSEKIREVYIRQFHKFEEENGCQGQFGNAEEKFMALGSPKFDKVLLTTRENVTIPDDWLAKIVKPDGSWKKVLLYNTSVNQLLNGEEQLLIKLQSVFGQIKDREDIVLLWRPHPLSRAACVAMRPELLEQYQKMVEEYKAEGWGIYDDTPDLHRAIALSDAYYGDQSSLVELYQVTGKPIMLQNIWLV